MKNLLVISMGALALAACGNDEPIADQRPAGGAPSASTTAATPPQGAVATERAAPGPMTTEPAVQAAPPPAATAQAAPAVAAGGTYTVQRGDTLYGIAESRDLTANDLARWNDISDPRKLRIGQELRLTAP